MLLGNLGLFDWLAGGDPADVRFTERGMLVEARGATAFEQDRYKRVSKDGGHFFFARKTGDFRLALKWRVDGALPDSAEFGAMVRIDEKNWFKAFAAANADGAIRLASSLAQSGVMDFAPCQTPSLEKREISFTIERTGRQYEVSAALPGESPVLLRRFSFLGEDFEIKAGAFLCSPRAEGFKAVLEEIQ